MAEKRDTPTKDAELPKKIPMCTGNLLFQMKSIGKTILGEEKLKDVINNLSPESKQIFTGIILSDHWYPESAVAELLDVGFGMVGKEAEVNIVRQAAMKEMNTVFKLFMRLLVSPQKFAENNKKLWDSIHDSGNFKVTVNEPKTHTIEISDFDIFKSEPYTILWMEYHAAILELTGAKNVKYITMQTRGKYIFKFEWD